jgi:hypothetical protein
MDEESIARMVILSGVTSSLTRYPSGLMNDCSSINYQFIDQESTRGIAIHRELMSHELGIPCNYDFFLPGITSSWGRNLLKE